MKYLKVFNEGLYDEYYTQVSENIYDDMPQISMGSSNLNKLEQYLSNTYGYESIHKVGNGISKQSIIKRESEILKLGIGTSRIVRTWIVRNRIRSIYIEISEIFFRKALNVIPKVCIRIHETSDSWFLVWIEISRHLQKGGNYYFKCDQVDGV